jgi:hypothetical protein
MWLKFPVPVDVPWDFIKNVITNSAFDHFYAYTIGDIAPPDGGCPSCREAPTAAIPTDRAFGADWLRSLSPKKGL